MALESTYIFDQTGLRGNFTFTNADLLSATFNETTENTQSGSPLAASKYCDIVKSRLHSEGYTKACLNVRFD
jgi:hypothetical protein